MIRNRGDDAPISADAFYALLRQYALSHRIKDEDGTERDWIDEDMDPFTGRWYARDELLRRRWHLLGGVPERGKDYNHSTFCDLVLSGLLGIHLEDGELQADPILPDTWDYFMVTGLTQDNWTVIYDKDGSHYGKGTGLRCFKAE